MRNGGYKGIIDPTTVGKTRGIHTSRDQYEKSKQFGGTWFSPSVAITFDDGAPNHNGTVNADGSSGDWSINTTPGTGTRLFSSKLRSGGKFYYEINIKTASGASHMVCPIAHQNATSSTQTYNIAGINMWYSSNGNFYPGGSSSGLGGFNTEPELLRCAYDMTAGKLWFGANDSWSTQTGDPDQGGAGVNIFGFSTYGDDGNYRVLFGNGSSGNINVTGEFLVGASLQQSAPVGFQVH